MRLLVLTQKVDSRDSNLGFFYGWLTKLAANFEAIEVICLEEGEQQLPPNVFIHSLGKERGQSRFKYLWNFYKYIFSLRYDGVLVHMTAQYAALGGPLWRLQGKKILLWYVHRSVDWRLWLGEKFVTKIFTASPKSFRLASKKVEIVGHGIDTDMFSPATAPVATGEIMLLSAGRIAPSKDLETIIKAVGYLLEKNIPVRLDLVGAPLVEADFEYQRALQQLAVRLRAGSEHIRFMGPRSYAQIPEVYRQHQIFVHTSQTGSIDKAVLEALACGLRVVTSSEAFAGLAAKGVVTPFRANDPADLAKTIEKICLSGILAPSAPGVEYVRTNHSLPVLIGRIARYFQE